jgi:hypothetical protein
MWQLEVGKYPNLEACNFQQARKIETERKQIWGEGPMRN